MEKINSYETNRRKNSKNNKIVFILNYIKLVFKDSIRILEYNIITAIVNI